MMLNTMNQSPGSELCLTCLGMCGREQHSGAMACLLSVLVDAAE